MTKETMIRNYRKFSSADSYILGFERNGLLYATTYKEIPPRFITVERESSKKGGHRKLQLRLRAKHMDSLIKRSTCLGSVDLLNGTYNKGVEFERVICEAHGIEWQGKDRVGFWEAGDLEIAGQQVQVKLNGAQIVVETTLENLKKRG